MDGVLLYITRIVNWIECYFTRLWCQGKDFVVQVFEEIMIVVIEAVGMIPLPDAIANFAWPDAGPFGHALIDLGVPQALSILASAFTFRYLRSLLPLIRS